MTVPPGVRGILLDIEGTTTPIAFVYEVLFPYARARLDAFCARSPSDPAVAEAVRLLEAEYEHESARPVEPPLPDFGNGAPYARHLMDRDSKSTGLKLLQGRIWEQGFNAGELRGQVFADVPPALERWREAELRLRIFSSGSVRAQTLFFRHSEHGDLSGYFEGFHDTTTGPKKDAGSYAEIARAFRLPPGAVLFLSDVVAELDAAASAAMRTGLVKRPGNLPTAPGPHPVFHSFT